MWSLEAFEKHVGELADIGIRRPGNSVFFIQARIKAVSPTHLFVIGGKGEEAIAYTEIVRIQFRGQGQPTAHGGAQS